MGAYVTQTTQAKLGFIGAGNMAAAIIGGLVAKGYRADSIWAADLDNDKLSAMKDQWGIQTSTDSADVCAQVNVVILAVKPQVLGVVCQQLHTVIATQKPLVISIAAGIEVASLTRWLGDGVPVVRCMPNTPALVQLGASGLYASDQVSAQQKAVAESILSAVGIALWVDEEAQIDTVTAVSGSGPAYYFMVMEAMIEAAIAQGLSPQVASALTLQTALGAATMAANSEFDPAELRRRVTSPNGTTERAIAAFTEGDLKGLFATAMQECAERSKTLSKELGGDESLVEI